MDAITQSEVQTLYSRQNASMKNVIEANDLVSLKELIQNGIDINKQDNDGDTGLHHAIRSDASIEVLRELIMTGANTTIESNAGYTPLHCINPESIDTMMNLLKLEKSCPLFDEINNNVLCVLVGGRISEDKIDVFWRTILKEFSLSDININLKNDLGETLLHVAARQIGIALEKHLNIILSTFENLSQFEKDLEGRTFLHIVFENKFTDNDGKYSDFITCLMQGRFPQCSKSIVRSLLNCQDNYKSTTLHMALRDPFNMIMPDILQIFVESGADLSLPSSYNLRMMHHVIRNRDTKAIRYITPENEVANIDYLATRGMDINAVDIFGGSPLYYSLLPDTITHLLNLGAQVGMRNKFGQTALVFHVCLIALRDWDGNPYNFDIFKFLLDNGSNVDALDNYGSSILHYAAWQCLPSDIVQLFLERGAKIYCDENGKFPCDVAFSRRKKDLVDSLCNCDSQRHSDDEIPLPDNETINDKELKELQWNDIESISNLRRQMMDNNFLSSLLRTPNICAVSFVGEAANLQSAVNKLI